MHSIRKYLGGNRLLDCLSAEELDQLGAVSEVVSLTQGQELYRQGGPMSHVYFPASGVCTVSIVMMDGKCVEVATVGNEGMIGVPAYLGLDFAPHTTLCQVPGDTVRLSCGALQKAVRQGGSLERIVRRYTAYGWRYASQTVACNTLHSVEERACRWLLMTHDRAGQRDFFLTHENLAEMLGVLRQTVTVVAGTLQRSGFIRYRRGQFRVVAREGLERAACECYLVMRRLYDCIMGLR